MQVPLQHTDFISLAVCPVLRLLGPVLQLVVSASFVFEI